MGKDLEENLREDSRVQILWLRNKLEMSTSLRLDIRDANKSTSLEKAWFQESPNGELERTSETKASLLVERRNYLGKEEDKQWSPHQGSFQNLM